MSTAPPLRLGTRGSPLALWQANTVAARIAETGGPPCRIIAIKTSGDHLQVAPLSEAGGKRLFVKEIEDALLRNEIDLAVHSSKDMPVVLPEGLIIGGVLPREDPRDVIVLPDLSSRPSALSSQPSALSSQPSTVGSRPSTVGSWPSALGSQPSALLNVEALAAALGPAPSVGTGSVRRIAQLSRLFPNARFTPIRGNLDTRTRKLDAGEYDALVLAAAGLRRLGFASRISFALPVEACVPAPGQGIVAIEVRSDDNHARAIVARIDDEWAGAALTAERALVEALGGGCQTPIGALASPAGTDEIDLAAVVIALDGRRVVRASARGPRRGAETLGARVAAQLIADGAADILADARGEHDVAGRRQL